MASVAPTALTLNSREPHSSSGITAPLWTGRQDQPLQLTPGICSDGQPADHPANLHLSHFSRSFSQTSIDPLFHSHKSSGNSLWKAALLFGRGGEHFFEPEEGEKGKINNISAAPAATETASAHGARARSPSHKLIFDFHFFWLIFQAQVGFGPNTQPHAAAAGPSSRDAL